MLPLPVDQMHPLTREEVIARVEATGVAAPQVRSVVRALADERLVNFFGIHGSDTVIAVYYPDQPN